MISLFKAFLKANLWRGFVSSLNEFQVFPTLKFNTEFTIICPYWRESIGRPRSKSCIVLVPFIDSCKISRSLSRLLVLPMYRLLQRGQCIR